MCACAGAGCAGEATEWPCVLLRPPAGSRCSTDDLSQQPVQAYKRALKGRRACLRCPSTARAQSRRYGAAIAANMCIMTAESALPCGWILTKDRSS